MKSLIVIISNPAARSSSVKKVKMAMEYLRQKGYEVELLCTERVGHGRELARSALEKKPYRIIAAGGDGTINEVINGMAGSSVPLAILPLGTTNVLAKELNIPVDIGSALKAALSGTARSISLGRVELPDNSVKQPRYFCLMAGIGFDAHAVYTVKPGIKKISGEGAYILSGITNLIHYAARELIFALDGKEYAGYAAIIGKASRYGGNFKVTPDADIHDPSLYICIFRGRRRTDLLRYVCGIVTGSHLSFDDIVYIRASCISVLGEGHMQVDGDYLGTTPATITVANEALTLVH